MLFRMYSVRDGVASDYSVPFGAVNDAVAYRQFKSLLKNSIDRNDWPDYSLWVIGTFDSENCKLVSMIEPIAIDVDLSQMDNANVEAVKS